MGCLYPNEYCLGPYLQVIKQIIYLGRGGGGRDLSHTYTATILSLIAESLQGKLRVQSSLFTGTTCSL